MTARVLSDIVNQNTINQLIMNSNVLLRFLQNIKTYGNRQDIRTYASNIKYMEFRSMDYSHVMVNPFLVTGLGRKMDQKLIASSAKLPFEEARSIAETSLLFINRPQNLKNKEQITNIIESTIILAKISGLSIFKGYNGLQAIFYLDLNIVAGALIETIQDVENSQLPLKKDREFLQETFNKYL